MIIAVDGPAASGKGTLARRLAAHFGLPYLDTGLLYRAIGHMMHSRGFDLDNAEMAADFAKSLDPDDLDNPALRSRQAGIAASRVAAHPGVRAALMDFQRNFAGQPGGAVLDGRDIGTVIAPEADMKLFVTARPEVRALRRYRELVDKGEMIESDGAYQGILADIMERDARDSTRKDAPLARAKDACELDTSDMDADLVVQTALSYITKRLAP